MQPAYEVADILAQHWQEVIQHKQINSWQLRTLSAIKKCRTADLGGHVDACTNCGSIRISYNSCRNRHSPKCQGNKREQWIQKRTEELLPVPYFHVVFTLPDALNQLAMHKPKECYDALFEAAWQTIQTFGRDTKHLGAQVGMISILHTWGQQLTLHPHLHCIVPGGGLTKNGVWKTAKSKGKYLFPVKAMSKVFRAKFVCAINQKINDIDKNLIDDIYKRDWVVFAKRPFGNAHSVVEYLGRYTHKIAISNHRIKNIDNGSVTFSYKNYRNGSQKEESTLSGTEFIRRFSMHILPRGYVRIRHYGILSSTSKGNTIPHIRIQVPLHKLPPPNERAAQAYNPLQCAYCKTNTMVNIETLPKRGPPKLDLDWIKLNKLLKSKTNY